VSQPQLDEDMREDMRENVRRTVGLAALRRLQRMVAAERAHQATRARWARRLSWALLAAAVAAVAWLAFR